MMLRRIRTGNGYRCGCCYVGHEDSDWTGRTTAEEFLDDCIDIIEQGRYGEDVSRYRELEHLAYEQEGEDVWACEVVGGDWELHRPGTDEKFRLFGHLGSKVTQPVDRAAALAWLQA